MERTLKKEWKKVLRSSSDRRQNLRVDGRISVGELATRGMQKGLKESQASVGGLTDSEKRAGRAREVGGGPGLGKRGHGRRIQATPNRESRKSKYPGVSGGEKPVKTQGEKKQEKAAPSRSTHGLRQIAKVSKTPLGSLKGRPARSTSRYDLSLKRRSVKMLPKNMGKRTRKGNKNCRLFEGARVLRVQTSSRVEELKC